MNIESYFTKQTDVRKIILEHLNKAETNVFVAVAWFTDTILFNKLVEIQNKGVSVEIIITKHQFNDESRNDYSLIEKNGGFFADIGSDEQLMHMKFCIIDYNTVISGSANWSNRAFTVNNEEVTIVTGSPQRTNDFIAEFERLKEISGKVKIFEEALDIAKALKYFKLFRALIALGETTKLQPYIHQIKHIEKLKPISNLLLAGKYDLALLDISIFEKNYTQLVDIDAIEKAQLISQIKLYSYQIEVLEIDKTEKEAVIEQFNHRYILELNPLISKILKLKKKIYEKLKKHGIEDDTYADIEEEFKQKNREYLDEKEIEIPTLNKEDSKDIKKMHKEAVKLCHPDSTSCIYEDKIEAAKVFDTLTKAFKQNDIDMVRHIWNELKLGNSIEDLDNFNELEQLKAKYESLKLKYQILFNELKTIQESEVYQTISSIENWDEYFETQKELLKEEYNILKEKFVKNEE